MLTINLPDVCKRVDTLSVQSLSDEKKRILEEKQKLEAMTLYGDDFCVRRDWLDEANDWLLWLDILIETLPSLENLHSHN